MTTPASPSGYATKNETTSHLGSEHVARIQSRINGLHFVVTSAMRW